jgi:shikimate kinase / 3-dehydroquinate synthase
VVGQDVGALGKHIALIGFMGAGKSTIGREVARLTERSFVDLDEEIEKKHGPIAQIFDERGEPEFRRIEEELAAELLIADELSVIALGGGAVLSEATRDVLRRHAFTVLVEIDLTEAWERSRASDRPLARDEDAFSRLYEERRPLYLETGNAVADDVAGVLLQALRIALATPGWWGVSGSVAIVADERVIELHPPPLEGPVHTVPPGEQAKTLAVAERLWQALELDRAGTIVAFGGGSTTDVAGYVAATYLRGIPWIAVPTTLVGQVDAAIGGKTGINLEKGKNLVGAFHFPEGVVLDRDVLATLPAEERRAGMAEAVKTGLLAGRDVWNLAEGEMIRACAAFKCAVVLSDPYERGRRAILNLGHTFAHALEAGSGYSVRHGDAVALGLLAALRLSGQPTDVVEEVLQPEPLRADPGEAWAALKRDKKGEGVFVLLEAPGKPVITTVPDDDARQALEALIQK